jgi:hypothetical protein
MQLPVGLASWVLVKSDGLYLLATLTMCSVPEFEGMEWNGSVPRSRDGSDPVFGSEKNEERNDSIPVFGFEMG